MSTSTELQAFTAPSGNPFSAIILDGEPWFIVKDVGVELEMNNIRSSVALLDPDERGVHSMDTPSGVQQVAIINESGLYSLILRSRKAAAKRFKKWITSEVLPALRRTGVYAINAPHPAPTTEIPRDYPSALRLAADEFERAEQATVRAEVAEHRVLELEPAAAVGEALTANAGLTLTQFHKSHFPDISESTFFAHLYRLGYLIDQLGKGTWSDKRRKFRDGAEHRHPTAKGKAFLYLHTGIDRMGIRRQTSRVRPGAPEVAFIAELHRRGLAASRPAITGGTG